MAVTSSLFRLFAFSLFITLVLGGCLWVKAPEQKPPTEDQSLSPLPELVMGEEPVRTPEGDMIALLPEGWLLLDAKDQVSSDIVAVAVNPEYTLSAVFSLIPAAASTQESLDQEGLLGLARNSFNKHARKTAGTAKLLGTYAVAEYGVRQFGTYEFSTAGSLRTRCAVFTSTLGHNYEFALVPMNVAGRDVPPDVVQQQAFRSILATIQY
jgi:hypothetical protein